MTEMDSPFLSKNNEYPAIERKKYTQTIPSSGIWKE